MVRQDGGGLGTMAGAAEGGLAAEAAHGDTEDPPRDAGRAAVGLAALGGGLALVAAALLIRAGPGTRDPMMPLTGMLLAPTAWLGLVGALYGAADVAAGRGPVRGGRPVPAGGAYRLVGMAVPGSTGRAPAGRGVPACWLTAALLVGAVLGVATAALPGLAQTGPSSRLAPAGVAAGWAAVALWLAALRAAWGPRARGRWAPPALGLGVALGLAESRPRHWTEDDRVGARA